MEVICVDMELIDFKDTCKIERDTENSDKYGNLIKEVVYEGICLYEEGGQSYSNGMVIRNPFLFIPSNDVLIYINDDVTITTFKGRVIKSLVENVRDISMKSKPISMTRIELKQGMGK